MRTASSSAHAGRRRPADASCRAGMWRRTRSGRPRGAQTHRVVQRRARRARCRGARDRGRVIMMAGRWRAGGGQGAVAHLQIKTSPRAVRSGAMRERGEVLVTAAGSVVQCASDTAWARAPPMAPAHLPVAVIRACAESEQQGLAGHGGWRCNQPLKGQGPSLQLRGTPTPD